MAGQAGTLERVWAPESLERVLAEHPLLDVYGNGSSRGT
jgi:hypothetical protein